MSGLDPTTAKDITTRLFSRQGHLSKAGVSVILATHNKRLLPYMNEIIVLESGKIADIGSYNKIQSRGDLKLMVMTDDDTIDTTKGQQNPAITTPQQQQPAKPPNLERRQGSWSVYSYYARSAGALSLSLWAFFTILGAITSNYMTIWISTWSSASTPSASNPDPNPNLGYYLGIYTLLVVLAQSGAVGECFVFLINIISHTALSLHTDLLNSVLSAPLSFFSQSSPSSSSPATDSISSENDNSENTSEDTGTITNRFSQDMDLIDMTLPIQAINVYLIILCVLGKYLAATIPLLAITLFLVQKYYLRSSRQLRLLDIEAKAPVYKHFLETVTSGGVVSIRAFGWGERWNKRLAKMVDEAQKPFYMLACIQQWLALVLDLVVGGMAVVLVGVAVGVAPDPEKGPSDNKTAVSAGALGVDEVGDVNWAVARVRDFVRTTPKEEDPAASYDNDNDNDNGGDGHERLAGWPSRAEIKIEKICASYGPATSSNSNTGSGPAPALKNLTLTIPAGSKLAVIGPSGSGKTTFLLSLLRMIPLSSGSITIDALNLSTIPRSRKSPIFNVIPQDPFFIPNTSLAFNLDPFSYLSPSHLPLTEAARAKMESALRLVTLWPGRVTANGQTLDSELITSEWSVGELQLLALARALLMKDKTKILVLDEATSSVDERTEAVMQEVIEREFKKHTVISVVHRLTYIERFDLVAVLKGGEMVEFGAPGGPGGLIEGALKRRGRGQGQGEVQGEGKEKRRECGSGSVFEELYRGFYQGNRNDA
ncbi:P-loop containing nucleoside triphosphate hydrolase protein [Copromyces sp. CBS 386.78]|nr:P-loop containing nucleoside triphosphate hydrolase protein [Copromyces sp. CBS 386.78]